MIGYLKSRLSTHPRSPISSNNRCSTVTVEFEILCMMHRVITVSLLNAVKSPIGLLDFFNSKFPFHIFLIFLSIFFFSLISFICGVTAEMEKKFCCHVEQHTRVSRLLHYFFLKWKLQKGRTIKTSDIRTFFNFESQ